MAGHSKWANIKHRKGRADAARGKVFSRVTKEIISAVKQGGPDVKSNAKLKLALQKAKACNMPNDNIERNIKKASSADQADFIEMTYELYGYNGVGIIAEVMTDNKNRISSDMRIATNKNGGSVATPGSVSFNFEKKGIIEVDKSIVDEDTAFQMASDAGAEDFDVTDDSYIIVTDPAELYEVKDRLTCGVKDEKLTMIPKVFVTCDEETRKSNFALIDYLEDLEDVDAVYHNME